MFVWYQNPLHPTLSFVETTFVLWTCRGTKIGGARKIRTLDTRFEPLESALLFGSAQLNT